jgi:hypothetical protein
MSETTTPKKGLYQWAPTDEKLSTFQGLNDALEILDNAILDTAPTWTNIALQNGVAPFAAGTDPIFTKIGNVVYIKGVVTNITAINTIIGTLPTGYKPTTMSHNFAAPTSTQNNSARIARWIIGTDGTIKLEGTTDGLYTAAFWYPIHTSFVVG